VWGKNFPAIITANFLILKRKIAEKNDLCQTGSKNATTGQSFFKQNACQRLIRFYLAEKG
jgi:hypothetical protein